MELADPEISHSRALQQPLCLSGFLGRWAGYFPPSWLLGSTDLPLISSSSSASTAACRGEAWPEHRTGISVLEAV